MQIAWAVANVVPLPATGILKVVKVRVAVHTLSAQRWRLRQQLQAISLIPEISKYQGVSSMKIVSAILLALSALSMAACNTVEGVGKDLKAGGEAIERTADENKK